MFDFLRRKRPRVFIVDKRFEHSPPEYRLYDVHRKGDFFVVEKYKFLKEYYVLEKGGRVRDRRDVTWLAVDDIPGLTDAV